MCEFVRWNLQPANCKSHFHHLPPSIIFSWLFRHAFILVFLFCCGSGDCLSLEPSLFLFMQFIWLLFDVDVSWHKRPVDISGFQITTTVRSPSCLSSGLTSTSMSEWCLCWVCVELTWSGQRANNINVFSCIYIVNCYCGSDKVSTTGLPHVASKLDWVLSLGLRWYVCQTLVHLVLHTYESLLKSLLYSSYDCFWTWLKKVWVCVMITVSRLAKCFYAAKTFTLRFSSMLEIW